MTLTDTPPPSLFKINRSSDTAFLLRDAGKGEDVPRSVYDTFTCVFLLLHGRRGKRRVKERTNLSNVGSWVRSNDVLEEREKILSKVG